MANTASLSSLPQTTLEDRFSALEAKFAALEKKYDELCQKTFTLTENSSGESTKIAVPLVVNSTSTKKGK